MSRLAPSKRVRDTNTIAESYHRSTVFDGGRFLWDVTTDRGVHPDVMSDIYVDMCPRGWFGEFNPTAVGANLPLVRLLQSASVHGKYTEYNDEIGHLFH